MKVMWEPLDLFPWNWHERNFDSFVSFTFAALDALERTTQREEIRRIARGALWVLNGKVQSYRPPPTPSEYNQNLAVLDFECVPNRVPRKAADKNIVGDTIDQNIGCCGRWQHCTSPEKIEVCIFLFEKIVVNLQTTKSSSWFVFLHLGGGLGTDVCSELCFAFLLFWCIWSFFGSVLLRVSVGSSRDSTQPGGHVLISYQWSCKGVCLRVRDRLRVAGYKVCMDADNMSKCLSFFVFFVWQNVAGVWHSAAQTFHTKS